MGAISIRKRHGRQHGAPCPDQDHAEGQNSLSGNPNLRPQDRWQNRIKKREIDILER
jgi:hypothetical protein